MMFLKYTKGIKKLSYAKSTPRWIIFSNQNTIIEKAELIGGIISFVNLSGMSESTASGKFKTTIGAGWITSYP